jgi:hypothetical protein
MDKFILGFMCMGFLAASLFFFQFWRRSGDRFFALFSLAFFVMSVNQLALLAEGELTEFTSLLYVVRLSAFLIILWAIIDKNRK